jgi:MYXO-CTERM domain-containing protein
VLTAAHCVDSTQFNIEPTAATARATRIIFDRTRLLNDEGIEVRGQRIVVDPAWKTDDIVGGHDIALIELEHAITDRDPMPYNTDAAAIGPGALVTFAGFGRTVAGAPATGVGNILSGRPVITCATLGDQMPLGDDTLLCFDQHDDAGICHGDSGGPVIAELAGVPTLVGVNSFVFDPELSVCEGFSAAIRSDQAVDVIAAALASTDEEVDDTGGCSTTGHGSLGLAGAGLAMLLARRRRA